jgi:hypothetical protein
VGVSVLLIVALFAIAPEAVAQGAHTLGSNPAPQAVITSDQMASFTTTGTINFQGELIDITTNNPVPDGQYNMRFAIYDAGTGGNKKWPASDYEQHTNVPVLGGLFNVYLGSQNAIGNDVFGDGGGRFLHVWVCTTAGIACATYDDLGRLPISSVGYAKSFTPGASVSGSGTLLNLSSSTTSGSALNVIDTAGSGNASAVYGQSASPGGAGLSGFNTSSGYGVYGGTSTGTGVYGYTSGSSSPTYGVYGYAPSNGYGVYGKSGSAVAGAAGGYFLAENTSGATYGLYAQNNSTTNNAAAGQFLAAGLSGQTYGVSAETYSKSPGAAGVYGKSSGDQTYGVTGVTSSLINGAGGYFLASDIQTTSNGVFGQSNSAITSAGGYFLLNNNRGTGYGVYGKTISTSNETAAGYFEAAASSGRNRSVYAVNNSNTYGATAGYFYMLGGETYALYAQNDSASDNSAAGYFYAPSTTGKTYGVYSEIESSTNGSAAGRFFANGDTGATYGIYAENNSSSHGVSGAAGYFVYSGTGDSHAIIAEASGHYGSYPIYANRTDCSGVGYYCYGVYTPDKIYAARFDTTPSDVAEYFPTDQPLEPGDVVVIDPANGRLVRVTKPNDTTVAGVISTQPGIALGSSDPELDLTNPTNGSADGNVPLALVGRVPVKVSAENGPIRPGDLLTTSSTPGHAMLAIPVEINGVSFYLPGTIIGKALESLEAGTGVILVLITLQ